MNLSQEEKRKRAELAEELEWMFHYLFVLMRSELIAYGEIDAGYYEDWLSGRYIEIAGSRMEDLRSQIREKSAEIIRVTIEGADPLQEVYALSDERAVSIAENEANYIRNYEQLEEARESGLRMKTWRTMLDHRVRESHTEMEGVTVPINEWFDVNGSLMMYPKDMSMGADLGEIAGCRCSLEFS